MRITDISPDTENSKLISTLSVAESMLSFKKLARLSGLTSLIAFSASFAELTIVFSSSLPFLPSFIVAMPAAKAESSTAL